MSNHRPTTLERAYELAQGGGCRTVGEIKQALQSEGFERIQDSLYGPSLTSALRKLCQAHYVAGPEGVTAAPSDDEDEDDH
jgi:hypothetical protein